MSFGTSDSDSAVALSPLAAEVRRDVEAFIAGQSELMFNEFDFQMQLALALRGSGRYDVDAEYFLPTRGTDILKGYDWDSNMRVDIVVSRGGEYVPVELKYTTRRVVRDMERFGSMVRGIEVMRQQSAQDIRRYDFWKDVRRIELIRRIFPAVHNGLAVFMTCDPGYLNEPREGSASAPFSMSGKAPIGGGAMDWNGPSASRADHKPFRLDGRYRLQWASTEIDGITFHYTIANI